MQVIVIYKDRDEDNKREIDIYSTHNRPLVESKVLSFLETSGDWHNIPLANIHEWRVRT